MFSDHTFPPSRPALSRTLSRSRKRTALTVIGSVLVMMTAGLVTAPAANAGTVPSVTVVAPTALKTARQLAFDQQLVGYVNQARVNAGLRPLSVSTGLARTASYWSVQMFRGATGGTLAHNPDLRQMVKTNLKTQILTWGENVASFSGEFSAREIFNLYMASPGHRANILNPRYHYIGAVTVAGMAPAAFNTINFAG